MRRALTNVGSISPTKLVRRVLSKTSNVSKSSNANGKTNKNNLNSKTSLMDLEIELNVLKEQLCKLQITVNSMRNDSEIKEETIANLARDKEKLSLDLKKEKRSNNNLKQQLEDEREFYFREKEMYCKEINECKKIKHKLKNNLKNGNNTNNNHQQKTNPLPQNEKGIEKLKEALNQTLEANYNLSVKFLRMKNTKYCLKNRLKKLQADYEKLKRDTEEIVERYKREMKELCHRQFNEPIAPSNKMHIQVIKENTTLLHENLLLRLEVDRLENELERYKMSDVRKETKKKLRYIRSKSTPPAIQKATQLSRDIQNNMILTDSTKHHQEKLQIRDEIVSKDSINNIKNTINDILVTESEMKILRNIKSDNIIDEDMEMIQISDNGTKTSSEISINECLDLERTGKQSILETEPSEYQTFSNS